MPCNQTMPVGALIDRLGGSLAVAVKCDVAQVTVQRWARENFIPDRDHFEPLRRLARMRKDEFYETIVLAKRV